MKRILITGKSSYVGISFQKWIERHPGKYVVDKISLRNSRWKKIDFSDYDVVLHVAGIVDKKETKKNETLYYQVNRDLAYEVAKKAKSDGVRHFLFLSSMSVYGMDVGIIDRNTVPKPKTNYGKSKLEAEELLESLNDDSYKVSILRPPMIYGKGCRGNYSRLASLAVKSPIFPDIENRRSMIYIDNLSELIKRIIDTRAEGLYHPQNEDYVNTTDMVRQISEIHGKRIKLTKVFNNIIKNVNNTTFKKVFGDLIYEKNLSNFEKDYNIVDYKKSIHLTENMENS